MQTNDINKVKLAYRDWNAVIDVQHGAVCISLKNEKSGISILREPPNNCDYDPFLYGMPTLFPPNRIEGGKFRFEKRDYVFPINEPETECHLHGELHSLPFEVIEKSGSRLVCRYTATRSRPYMLFPHEFEIITEYELSCAGFLHSITVKNNSKKNMPLFIGVHTNFNTLFSSDSKKDDICVKISITDEFARDEKRHLPTGEVICLDEVSLALRNGTYAPFSSNSSRHYRGAGEMSISDTKKRLRTVYECDEKFGYRMIYNNGEEDFISLEPMSCLVNCQNSPFPREDVGFDYLHPDEKKRYRSRIYVESY